MLFPRVISLSDVMSYDNATYGKYTNSLFNPFLGNGDFCRLDNLHKQFGPRSGPTKVGPDLDPNCLTL